MKEGRWRRLRILAIAEKAETETHFRDAFERLSCDHGQRFEFDLCLCRMEDGPLEKIKTSLTAADPFAVVLVESDLTAQSPGIRAGEEIRALDGQVNFVVVSERFDSGFEEANVRILPTSKVLFLQKPFRPEVLVQFAAASGAMWLTEKELQKVNSELYELNTQLMETNTALSVLAKNLERTRKESEMRIVRRTRTLIIPIIEKLQREKNLKKYRVELDLLSDSVESLTADLTGSLKITAVLSGAEMKIASMIKNGMSSEDIARHLNISVYTVKTHRKNIRRKLKLKNSGTNLKVYLQSEPA